MRHKLPTVLKYSQHASENRWSTIIIMMDYTPLGISYVIRRWTHWCIKKWYCFNHNLMLVYYWLRYLYTEGHVLPIIWALEQCQFTVTENSINFAPMYFFPSLFLSIEDARKKKSDLPRIGLPIFVSSDFSSTHVFIFTVCADFITKILPHTGMDCLHLRELFMNIIVETTHLQRFSQSGRTVRQILEKFS